MGLGYGNVCHEAKKDEAVGDLACLCCTRIWTDLRAYNSYHTPRTTSHCSEVLRALFR